MSALQDVLSYHDASEAIIRGEDARDALKGLRARLVRVDGTHETVYLPADHVTGINAAIGSHSFDCIEVVPMGAGKPGLDAWIDDDGLFTKAPNLVASAMVRWFTDQPYQIHGDVLFTGGADSEGETLPLTRIQDAILADAASELSRKARALHML